LVSHIKARTWTEGVQEQGAKDNIWTQDSECNGRLEELHNIYSSSNTTRVINSRRMSCAGHVAHMKAMRNAYKTLVRKPEGKRPLGRPMCRQEDNI